MKPTECCVYDFRYNNVGRDYKQSRFLPPTIQGNVINLAKNAFEYFIDQELAEAYFCD